MRLQHVVAFSNKLRWLAQTKVITLKKWTTLTWLFVAWFLVFANFRCLAPKNITCFKSG